MTGTTGTDNSYSLEIDGGTCYTVGDNNAIPTNTWTWVDYRDGTTASKLDLNLTAGNHTVKLIGRESAVKVDRVIAAADTTCVPNGVGDNCVVKACDLKCYLRYFCCSGKCRHCRPNSLSRDR